MIRNFRLSDYETIRQWWGAANEPAPPIGAMPFDSTFVYESNGRAVMSLSIYLTNAIDVTYLENFISAPDFSGPERSEAGQKLVDHASEFARELGYKNTLCFCYRDALKHRYQELGMKLSLEGATVFTKGL